MNEISYGNINEQPLWKIWESRPEKLDTTLLYEYCRFREQNEVVKGLKNITHSGMI